MHRADKDGHTRNENRHTQPLRRRRAFAQPGVVTEGWYPACRSRALERGHARSVRIGWQRVAVFRDASGKVYATDAFCPHMGADLGNGIVEGDTVRCRMHGWRFRGDGTCVGTASGPPPPQAKVLAWPVHEALGTVWVYAGQTPAHPFPTCPGLEGQEVAALRLGRVRLYAHHHAMMVGGIDLQHFKAVHDLDIRFEVETLSPHPGVLDFVLDGAIPDAGWRGRLGRRLLGDRFRYALRVAGGSIAAITYGRDQRWFGTGSRMPALHVLWGCHPQEGGISEVEVFVVAPLAKGVMARLKFAARIAATLGLLAVLDDDDKRAFPHMRFDPGALVEEDHAVIELMRHLDALPIAVWSEVQA